MNLYNQSDRFFIGKHDVHVWIINFEKLKDQYLSFRNLLTDQERNKEAQFYSFELKMRYTLCRGVLRRLLNRYLGNKENQIIDFSYGKYGKPFLDHNLTDLKFNISHSQDFMVCGISKGFEIGVDIEFIRRDIPIEELQTYVFSPSERVNFNSLSDKEKILMFFKTWTYKEAFVKAIGIGLTKNLTEIELSFVDPEMPKVLSIDGSKHLLDQWCLKSLEMEIAGMGLEPFHEHIGAIVARRAYFNLQLFQYGNGNF